MPVLNFEPRGKPMPLMIEAVSVPLRTDEDGVVRVGGTRVTLDTIVTAFQQGETPQAIADQYPGVALPDIYTVIAYYLQHAQEVETYLDERKRQHEAVRQELLARSPQEGIRDRLSSRRAGKR